MESKLRWNDFKPGWKTYLASEIMVRVRNKLENLSSSLVSPNPKPTLRTVVDMANYLMFLLDNERLYRPTDVRPELQIVANYLTRIASLNRDDEDRKTWELAIAALAKLARLSVSVPNEFP